MKKLFIIPLLLIFCVSAFAELPDNHEKQEQKIVQQCPKTKVTDGCLRCHVIPSFALKESKPDATMDYPNYKTKIRNGIGYLIITDIDDDQVYEFFNYISWHKDIKHVVLELQSPGGSMFRAWRIVGLMELYKSRGYIVETRTHGFAASAGFLIFASGTKGYRFASKTAELMWHELITFKIFDVSGPSDKEDEAKVLRHLQQTASGWLASRSNIPAEKWNEKIHKKEFWMNGGQAIDYGISDGVPK